MQGDPSWSNVRIGNTSSAVGRIAFLVTSIAILIEKSGVNTTISPFNPGTFVEALKKLVDLMEVEIFNMLSFVKQYWVLNMLVMLI